MEQHTASLPIACVEGWSTDNQAWTGVRLRDLARLAGVSRPASVLVQSLERGGAFSQAVLSAGQIMDPDSLLALRVNGADLSLDHGYPARVIVPANPGVHNTKWVASLTFAELTCAGSAALVRRQSAAPARPARLLRARRATPPPGCCRSTPVGVAVWFVGAVIGHDLLLMPLYSLADRSVMAVVQAPPAEAARGAVDQLPARPRRAVRPAAADLVPADPPAAVAVSTRRPRCPLDPYLWHWLAVTGALFLLSAVAFALRLRGQSRTAAPPERPAAAPAGTGPEPESGRADPVAAQADPGRGQPPAIQEDRGPERTAGEARAARADAGHDQRGSSPAGSGRRCGRSGSARPGPALSRRPAARSRAELTGSGAGQAIRSPGRLRIATGDTGPGARAGVQLREAGTVRERADPGRPDRRGLHQRAWA